MKHFWRASLIVVVGLFFMGCAAQQSMTKDWKTGFTAQDLNAKVKSGEYVKKVDNFLVILDASGSMADAYKGKNKLNLAKDTISRMNQTIPDLDLMAALRAFGRFEFWPLEESKLLYGPTNYSKGGLEGALNGVAQGRGQSPLMLAINGASQDLKAAAGKIAVILFSDGDEEDMNHAAAINAAKALKGQFGDRVCIYTVQIGNDSKGKRLMQKVTDAGLCGFSVNADDIASSGAMADFVEKIFLAKAPPKPAEPAKPAPAKAGPRDSDGDGVFDDVDRCPGTPMGARVDSKGCWILENVLFDFDKTVIKAQYYPELDEVAAVLKKNPNLKMALEGHTDSIGNAKYNKALSKKRAKVVMDYLLKKGVNKDQLAPMGYGLTRPVATNKTKEGRVLNRRTELKRSFR